MKIVFIGHDFSIYDSNASTNLIYAFALGFQGNGCQSILLIMANEYAEPSGHIGPIEYYIPLAQKTRNNVFIVRNYYKAKKYINAIRFCWNLKIKNEPIVLICYTLSPIFSTLAYFLNKLYFNLSFIYLVEHPSVINNNVNKCALTFYKTAFSKMFDGQIFISEGLRNIFKTNVKNIVVPSMVVHERFASIQDSPFPFKYIGYCGTITRIKDGVHILVRGFKLISSDYPLLKLVIIGDFLNEVEREYFIELVEELKLSNQVIFAGKVSKNNLPKYLQNAEILALSRPKNLQSETGFPTKLPEYLATGKPVVITRVGDIPLYLSDGENAYITEPDDVEALANSFKKILSNYVNALKVGERGKLLAETVFNPKVQAGRVINLINDLMLSKKA